MLSKAQWWGREEQARAHPSTGKGAAVQHEAFITRDPWGCSLSPLTFGSWDAHLSLLSRRSWNGSISSEKVHEVLSHVGVGREDPADAGRPLGPRLAWWALDSVGQPLQQALTLQVLRHAHSQLVVIQAPSKAGPEGAAVATVHATLCCCPVASAQATVRAKGSPFA